MTDDPRALLDAYGGEEAHWNATSGAILDREDAAPKAFAALRAVLAKHPMVHLDGKFICHGCTHLLCEDERPAPWPCPTVQAITAALEAEES